MEIADHDILEAFVKAEMESPSARKSVGGTTIHASRTFDRPKRFGKAVLGDFGSAARGDEKLSHLAQPNIYRSPEVMLKAEWSYPIDVWNIGCMVYAFASITCIPLTCSRFGTFSKISTYFPAGAQTEADTGQNLTSLKSLQC